MIRLTMLCLSGCELYCRWVPLKYEQSDRQGEAIEIFHRCFDFMLPVCDTFMDRDAEKNSKRL